MQSSRQCIKKMSNTAGCTAKKRAVNATSFLPESKKGAEKTLGASCFMSEMIAKVGKQVTECQFMKDKMLQVANIVNTATSVRTEAKQITELSSDICEPDKDRSFILCGSG